MKESEIDEMKMLSPPTREFSLTIIKSFFKKGNWQSIRNFSEEDICLALTIRGYSLKTYTLLRDRKIIPLPGFNKNIWVFRLVSSASALCSN